MAISYGLCCQIGFDARKYITVARAALDAVERHRTSTDDRAEQYPGRGTGSGHTIDDLELEICDCSADPGAHDPERPKRGSGI